MTNFLFSPWGKTPLPDRTSIPSEPEQRVVGASCCGGSFVGLSAGKAGLVGCFDRHEATKEKFPNDGKQKAQPGNLTARKRNAC